MKLLIVEDETELRRMMAETLREAGYVVETARTYVPAEAVPSGRTGGEGEEPHPAERGGDAPHRSREREPEPRRPKRGGGRKATEFVAQGIPYPVLFHDAAGAGGGQTGAGRSGVGRPCRPIGQFQFPVPASGKPEAEIEGGGRKRRHSGGVWIRV